MKASVIIPVWNGAEVLDGCLKALYADPSEVLSEVICIDNASQDGSAELIEASYPQVRLERQPVNLGFAGGVNAGLEIAGGDLLVLLNQDCIVRPGWLQAFINGMQLFPKAGIAGGTIFNPDGSVNHAGAVIRLPDVIGVHLTEVGEQIQNVPYVTGAAFAITRQAWQATGRFDEGYYPAYFEECDYCFRARRAGFEVIYIPQVHVRHLFSSREWMADATRHSANQFASRYRFVSKHLSVSEIQDFLEYELTAIEKEAYLDNVVGRVLAARQILRGLEDVLARRRQDLGETLPPAGVRQLQVAFTRILRQSFYVARRLLYPGGSAAQNAQHFEGGEFPGYQAALQEKEALRQREHELLEQIFHRKPGEPLVETRWQRLSRLLFKRLPEIVTGKEYRRLAELNALHVSRLDQMGEIIDGQRDLLRLLELLVEYDYR